MFGGMEEILRGHKLVEITEGCGKKNEAGVTPYPRKRKEMNE